MLWNADWTRSPIATLPSIVSSDGLIQDLISAVNGAITGMFVNTSERELVGSGGHQRDGRISNKSLDFKDESYYIIIYTYKCSCFSGSHFFIYLRFYFLNNKKSEKREELKGSNCTQSSRL